jgi:hypothetical protein
MHDCVHHFSKSVGKQAAASALLLKEQSVLKLFFGHFSIVEGTSVWSWICADRVSVDAKKIKQSCKT